MAIRKTITIAKLVDMANTMLATSTCGPDQRWGVIILLEKTLLDAGVYNGFSSLTEAQVPAGELPGIRRERGIDNLFDNTDQTRVAMQYKR